MFAAAQLEAWMDAALAEAGRALEHDDVPVGAVIVDPAGRVIAARHNERERTNDPTAHAELLALRDAAQALGTWHLEQCLLVVTLEPCAMCAGAALHARIGGVVFGTPDLRFGALGSRYQLLDDPRLNHRADVVAGIRAEESAALLQQFFSARR
jgi:tRNA(adenine34) deaminase